MPLPPSWNQVTITGTFLRRDGTPNAGTIEFRSPQLTDSNGNQIAATRTLVRLDETGSFEVTLPATDDPDMPEPRGWAYLVTEYIAEARAPYYISVPYDSGTINLVTAPHTDGIGNTQSPYVRKLDIGFSVASQAAVEAAAADAASALAIGNEAVGAINSRIDNVVSAQASGMLGYETKAAMDADLIPSDQSLALVTNDPTPANNIVYRKSGASGAGTWVAAADRVTVLESDFVEFSGNWNNAAGKLNGWPDTFFRVIPFPTQTFYGRDRWYSSVSGFSLVENGVFDGKALRRADGYNQTSFGGPMLWFDEMDASEGDEVTLYILVTGSAGGKVYCACSFWTAADAGVGAPISLLSKSGANNVVASATPQWLRKTVTVPATAAKVAIYPYNVSGATGFDVLAVWAFKGGVNDGPDWPTMESIGGSLYNAEQDARIAALEALDPVFANADGAIRTAYLPYTVYEHPLGDAELLGDADYSNIASTIGFYEKVTEDTTFNTIECHVWQQTPSDDVEWKVWIRDSATAFNMESTAAASSGTIAAADFPDANELYKLQLPVPVFAAANKYVFVMFRGATGTRINVRRWIYNAAVTPARHGFPFSTSSGWNNTFAYSNPAISYGQATFRLLLESEEARSTPSGITEAQAQSIAEGVVNTAPELVLPPYVFGVQGRESNLYYDNLFLTDASEYNISAISTLGIAQKERWTYTPAGAASGSLAVSASEKRGGQALVSGTSQVRAAAASAGTGSTKKVLVVGDSLISAGAITQTLIDIASADVMGVTLLGTRGSGANLHEGRGGWTVNDYTTVGRTYYQFTVSGVVVEPDINSTKYSNNGAVYTVQEKALSGGSGTITCSVDSGGAPTASGTLTKVSGNGDASITFSASAAQSGNPFWIGGVIDFPQYLVDHAVDVPDWVFIALGINDVFSATSDDSAATIATSRFTLLDTLIASIKAAGASVKVGLLLPSPPSADQDAFGANYGSAYSRWRFKRNILIWSRELITKYAGQEASRVYIVPSNVALDTVNNMNRAAAASINSRNSAITLQRQNNGVHPDTPGYQQIGDAMWAFLKYYAGA